MFTFPKFIIENDSEYGNCIIMGKCSQHIQLAHDEKKVISGGWWTIDSEKNYCTFHGKSIKFGGATLEEVSDCVLRNKVFSSKTLSINLTDKYTFFYKDELGNITQLLKKQ